DRQAAFDARLRATGVLFAVRPVIEVTTHVEHFARHAHFLGLGLFVMMFLVFGFLRGARNTSADVTSCDHRSHGNDQLLHTSPPFGCLFSSTATLDNNILCPRSN